MSHNVVPAALAIVLSTTLVFVGGHVEVVSSFLPEPNQPCEVFPILNAVGPETLAFDRNGGGPYTGVSDGRIIKWQANESRWINFAVTTPHRYGCEGPLDHTSTEPKCGRPLGLSFNHNTSDLYIADAYMGLLVVGPNGGLARPLAKEAQGIPFRFTNGVVVDQKSGQIYFTDSSTRFQRREFGFVMVSLDKTGRLLKFDPTTNKVTVLMGNLMFPNGVALSKTGDFLLITETTNSRILKFWLEPTKAGRVEVFAELPGIPDNINRNQQGEFWVAVNSKNGESIRYGLAVKLNENGDILKTLEDKTGKTWKYGSDIVETNGYLWIGSVIVPYVVKLKISS
ncbi:hypothetical protein ACH5RR_007105 [Cinchona calisaya]|uniref:Strictosidine synthase conserved region domain-containing protein n=1 Tax=Cinchona calisaya TaxID=153742 RepID=A0ABD3ARC5_9GENT